MPTECELSDDAPRVARVSPDNANPEQVGELEFIEPNQRDMGALRLYGVKRPIVPRLLAAKTAGRGGVR